MPKTIRQLTGTLEILFFDISATLPGRPVHGPWKTPDPFPTPATCPDTCNNMTPISVDSATDKDAAFRTYLGCSLTQLLNGMLSFMTNEVVWPGRPAPTFTRYISGSMSLQIIDTSTQTRDVHNWPSSKPGSDARVCADCQGISADLIEEFRERDHLLRSYLSCTFNKFFPIVGAAALEKVTYVGPPYYGF